MSMCKDPELMPDPEALAKALREPLLKVFPPALLGRLVVDSRTTRCRDEMLGEHRPAAARPHRQAHRATTTTPRSSTTTTWSSSSSSLCNEPETGGRMIDAILTNTLLPALSREFLRRSLAARRLRKARGDDREGRVRFRLGVTGDRPPIRDRD